jgi:cytochrome c oxidase cbb3-type subunit 3
LRALIVAGGLLALLAGAAGLSDAMRVRARLVREDPDAIPAEARLMRFGVAVGAPLFAGHCASCHGAAGKGQSSWGVPDLTDTDWLYGEGKVSDIERVVRFGVRAHDPRTWKLASMPAYGRAVPSATEKVPPLRPNEIRDVTAYVLSLGGRPGDPDAVRRGAKIFGDTGGCYDCHTPDAKGDPAIGAPNLTDRIWLYGDGSAKAVARSIAYGRQGVCPAWTGRLSPLQQREVALYVYALSHRAPAPPAKAE